MKCWLKIPSPCSFRSSALTSTQTMNGSRQSQMPPMLIWTLYSGAYMHPLQHQKTFEYVKCAHVSSHGRFWELSRQQWICNFSNYFKFMVCLLWKCLPCQLRNSNFITIHVPLLPQVWKLKKHFEPFENRFLTPFSIHIWPKSSFCHNMQTHHLINAEAFAKMKDDVVLVNTRWISSSYQFCHFNCQSWWDRPSALLDQSSRSQEDVGSGSWRFRGRKKVRLPLFQNDILNNSGAYFMTQTPSFKMIYLITQVHISWPVQEWFPRRPPFGPAGRVWPCHSLVSHCLLHWPGKVHHHILVALAFLAHSSIFVVFLAFSNISSIF